MELGKTLALFGTGTSWAEAMDQLMPEWMDMDAKPVQGKPSIAFPEGQKERFDNVFLEAWGTFAAAHQADGIDCVLAYMKKGMWRKMTTAATRIQKDLTDLESLPSITPERLAALKPAERARLENLRHLSALGTYDVFSLTDDQLRGQFIRLFEEKYEGFKTSVYKGAIGVGAELTEEEFINALIAKVLGATGGARKRRSTRRKRVVKRKSVRKTKKTRKARKASRKTYRKH
jgi:hypothetical protein